MKIESTLGNIDETIYEYDALLGWAGGVDFQQDKETLLGIANYRIQIPELGLSVREGTLYYQTGGEYYTYHDSVTGETIERHKAPPEDAPWEPEASIVLLYKLEEKDPTKYMLWSTNGIQSEIHEYLWPRYNNVSDLDDIPCFIDSSDFMENEEEAMKYAKECEERFKENPDSIH